MGHYIRILSPATEPVPGIILQDAVSTLGARLEGEVEDPDWTQLEVLNATGETLLIIERNVVSDGSLGQEEILEFDQEVSDCFPKTGAEWVRNYLQLVKAIYCIQIYDAIDIGNGWGVLAALKNAVWATAGGIFQADREGFSNEDGYHIVWQFSDHVTGDWWMSILIDGAWRSFKMDLGNRSHRLAFQAGQIPDGVERLS